MEEMNAQEMMRAAVEAWKAMSYDQCGPCSDEFFVIMAKMQNAVEERESA